MRLGSSHRLGCHLRSSKTVQSVYRIAASIAHAQGWLSTPLAREYVCQWCGKALPPLGIEPLPPAPKARALKDRAIWTLVVSHRYRRGQVHIHPIKDYANYVYQHHLCRPKYPRFHHVDYVERSIMHIRSKMSIVSIPSKNNSVRAIYNQPVLCGSPMGAIDGP